jgi:hypothetical protein
MRVFLDGVRLGQLFWSYLPVTLSRSRSISSSGRANYLRVLRGRLELWGMERHWKTILALMFLGMNPLMVFLKASLLLSSKIINLFQCPAI